MAYYKNIGFVVYLPLGSQADTDIFQASATIASGDAKLSIDGGALSNLTTLPAVTPASSKLVKFTISAAENSGSEGAVIMSDAAGDEWQDLSFSWQNDTTTLDSGTAQAGAASTITLRSGAVATNNYYNHGIIQIISGTGAGQSRQIVSYVGSTLVATVAASWATNPDNTSVYIIQPGARAFEDSSRTLTQSAASVTAVVTGSNISVARGTTWSIALTNIGALTNYDTVYMTVKMDDSQADSAALLQVYNNASGLIRFNGAAPVAATNGVITIDDIPTGDITVTVQEAETVSAPLGTYLYDIKGIDDNGQVDLISSGGRFTVTADITKAITSPA